MIGCEISAGVIVSNVSKGRMTSVMVVQSEMKDGSHECLHCDFEGSLGRLLMVFDALFIGSRIGYKSRALNLSEISM